LITTDTGEQPKLRAAAVIPILDERLSRKQVLREEETAGLVVALDADCVFVQTLFIRRPSPSHLFSSGHLDAIKQRLEAEECDLFVVDGELSPIQQRNLERSLGCKVIDRTGLILEIFGLRARTKAGRLQVETARLAYERSRLVRTWTHLERQRGGRGFISGPGETQIEADRRMIDNALIRLKKQLKEVERTRRVQRSSRSSNETPVVALVGYTNAGKSTLFNQLASSDVFAKDMPFATLDPTIRRFDLDKGIEAALVDTVGFITDLPTTLVEAFKGTLEESLQADLLLHVHDASSPDAEVQSEDVMQILESLEEMVDIPLPPIIDVWNKIDRLSADEKEILSRSRSSTEHGSDAVQISAITGEGMEELRAKAKSILFRDRREFILQTSADQGQIIAWLYAHGEVLAREDLEDDRNTVELRVRLGMKEVGQLERQFTSVEYCLNRV
tara:strand:- start:41212 stop:42549 length:1338 start_codon:yes stop_codon:yes gene_type:complete